MYFSKPIYCLPPLLSSISSHKMTHLSSVNELATSHQMSSAFSCLLRVSPDLSSLVSFPSLPKGLSVCRRRRADCKRIKTDTDERGRRTYRDSESK